MFSFCLVGANGKMGSEICKKIIGSYDIKLVAAVDEKSEKIPSVDFETHKNIFETNGNFDLIIDFSSANNIKNTLNYAIKFNKKLVIGVTGILDDDFQLMKLSSKKIPIFYSRNMSLGIHALTNSIKVLAKILKNKNFDINIIDIHHKKKLDSPSGTAIHLGEKISEENEYRLNLNCDINLHKKISSDVSESICKNCEKENNQNKINFHSIRSGNNFGEHIIIFDGENEKFEIKHKAFSRDIFVDGAINAARWISSKENGFYEMSDVY